MLKRLEIKNYFIFNRFDKVQEVLRKHDKKIVIFAAKGKRRIYKYVNKLVSMLRLHPKEAPKIIVILDKNHEDVLNTVFNNIGKFIKSPCKFHQISPKISQKSNLIVIDYQRKDRILEIGVFVVENSLETNIKNSLMRKYKKYSDLQPHDFIRAIISQEYQGDKDRFFTMVLTELSDEMWIKELEKFLKIQIAANLLKNAASK